jgi:hypothetical protein
MRVPSCWLPTGALVLVAAACQPALPDDVDCSGRVLVADSDDSLTRSLVEAGAGDCVVLRSGSYSGDRSVPAGVVLTGERDGDVRIAGEQAPAALRLDHEDATAAHLAVREGSGLGLWITAPGVVVQGVQVTGFDGGAVGIRCQDAGCAGSSGWIQIEDSTLSSSRYGLGLAAGQVRLRDTRSLQHRSTGLSGGLGLFVTGSSSLDLVGGEIRDCDLGAVIDGGGARATLQDVHVTGNSDRGVWAQGLRGSTDEAALHILGAQTRIENNGYVGVGLHDSQDVRLEAARIAATTLKPVPVELGTVQDIGDGLAVLAGSARVVVDGTTLDSNGRSQMLVDHGGDGIAIRATSAVSAGQGQYLVVVQNTTASVEVPAGLLSPVSDLPVRGEPRVSVPELSAP